MNSAFDFIRDFKLADYGVTGWHFLFGFIGLTACSPLLKWLVSLRKLRSEKRIAKVIDVTFLSVLYLIILLSATHYILNKSYFFFFFCIFWLIMTRNLVDNFFSGYDKLADRLISKTIKSNPPNNPKPDTQNTIQ